ncbi:MAG: phage tail protein [Vicinamibacterales bacterium]
MPSSSRNDPLSGFNIRVEISGITAAGFTECTGLSSETEVVSYREGTDRRVRRLPGLTKFANVTLKRGISTDRALWDWRQAVVDGQVDRRVVSIVLMDAARNEVARWNLFEAWPAKWEGPTLNASSSAVAIETLEIAHEGLEWAS